MRVLTLIVAVVCVTWGTATRADELHVPAAGSLREVIAGHAALCSRCEARLTRGAAYSSLQRTTSSCSDP
jgi:hypothetical protein